MKLHEYLKEVSPEMTIRVDNGEGSIFFYGSAGEITESNKYLNAEVIDHVYGKFGHDILYISIA
jgi:hypothetical protein